MEEDTDVTRYWCLISQGPIPRCLRRSVSKQYNEKETPMLKNFKIGTRLGFGFGLIMLLLIVVGLTGYWGVKESTNTTIEMLRGDAAVSEHASRARANIVGMRRYEKDIFLNIGQGKEKESEYLKKWQEQAEHLNTRITEMEKAATLPNDK